MQDKQWSKLVTIPAKGLQNSIHIMTEQQIDLNIIQICLVSLYNEHIMKWLIESMQKIQFYLKYRYILTTVMNGVIQPKHKNMVNEMIDAFDAKYVNGKPIQKETSLTEINTEDKLMESTYSKETAQSTQKSTVKLKKPQIKITKNGLKKQKKVRFIQRRQLFIESLDQITEQMFKIQQQQAKQEIFKLRIGQLNQILAEEQQIEAQFIDSQSSQNQKEILSKMNGYCFMSHQTLLRPTHIEQKSSFPIKTKNRAPIVLDLVPIGRFIYKNDDQLSHQLIAMRLIRYLNKLLGKEYIIEYEIIVQSKGALYQFIQGAKTVSQIKKLHQGGLNAYFQDISEGDQSKRETLEKKFAQTYSGFCLAQYLLDIKDRNNGNIMIRSDGSIFHIDLAFIFEAGPGGLNFESAPFKMTKQYVALMGGFDSNAFKLFQTLLIQHLTKIHECQQQLLFKVQTLGVRDKEIRCFNGFKFDVWKKKIPKKKENIKQLVEDIIDKSYDSWKTNKYDDYQFKTNGILK